MTVYAKHFSTKSTPQSQPIPGKQMEANNAGGFTFAIDDWARLDRFLVIGSSGGTYYVSEQKLTVDNASAVLNCIKQDGKRTVDRIVEISHAGRAPKNDPAIFALALAAAHGNQETKQYALASLNKVCRIGTHLFQFAESVQAFRGWGRSLRRAVGNWYTSKERDDLAYQLVKYQQRNGWSHKNLLMLSHVGHNNADMRWVIGADMGDRAVSRCKDKKEFRKDEYPEVTELSPIIAAFEQAKKATSAAEIVKLITDHDLPRECIPTQHLNSVDVWDALLAKMPMNAMVRNLAKMTSIGLLAPMSDGVNKVLAALGDVQKIHKSRLHPMALLMALRTYAAGKGEKGKLTWTPVPQVIDALNQAFYQAFANVEPTNKRWLLGIDVSGSMACATLGGSSLTAAEAATAMAMVTAHVEPKYYIHGFAHTFKPLNISKGMRLDDALKETTRQNFGNTDCALPMLHATQHKIPVDVFVVYTDNETWAGNVQPCQALQQYRNYMGINAKLIVCGMTATKFSIADPNDMGQLDVVGFDSATPQVMAEFAKQ